MSKSGRAALVALVTLGQPTWADVTPDEVWLSWQNLALSQGQKITADSADLADDTLTLTGVTVTLGQGGSAVLPQIKLTDTGDGSVTIVMPDSFPVRLIPPMGPGETTATVDLTVTAPGAQVIASGVPLSINYAKNLPKLDLTAKGPDGASQMDMVLKATGVTGKYLSQAAEVGQNLLGEFAASSLDLSVAATDGTPSSDVAVKLALTALAGKLDLTGLPADEVDLDVALASGLRFDGALSYGIGSLDISGTEAGKPMRLAATLGGGNMALSMDATKFHYDINTKAISLNLAGHDTASGGDFTFTGALADLSNTLDINGVNWSKSDDFGAALKAGLVMAGSAGLGSTNIDFAGGPTDAPVRVKASLASAKTNFTLAATQLTYDLAARAVALTIAAPDLPVPELSGDLGELAVVLAMPVAKSATPAPFSSLTRIIDLKLPEALWALFDPTGTLPHDPATLIIDTKGTATVTRDLIDDAADLQTGEDAPGVFNSLEIPQLLARAMGAEVTAKGGFTFDPADTETFDMPLPTGKIDIRGTGLNKLIDTLVTMGLLPQDQAVQGKMMLSMFALNDMTKDEITTTLEFRDKHFFANGAQIQ